MENSEKLHFDASRTAIAANSRWLAGGVSSNFRVGMSPHPLLFKRGEGAYLIDADDNRLIDYYLGMGPMILGHNPVAVRDAVVQQMESGILLGGQSEIEAEAAQLLCEAVPCAERMRFCSSGSEAVQAALRLARAATSRDVVVKFEGHYHGWFDNILWSTSPSLDVVGPEEAPAAVPGSRGQSGGGGSGLAVLPWNDLGALEGRLAAGDCAAVIMEAIMCNAGGILPAQGYLEGVREACRRHGVILIFDEVITGFRVDRGGAQRRLGVTPDLAIFGKALANGYPVAAIAGRAELLDLFTTGGVVHGGTYNGQLLGMAATVATLRSLTDERYLELERAGNSLMAGISAALADAGIPATVTGCPQAFHVAFGLQRPARNYRELAAANRPLYVTFCKALLERGVRALERGTWFLSTEHSDTIIEETLVAVRLAVRELTAKI